MLDKKLLQDVWEEIEQHNKSYFKTGFEDLDLVLGLNENRGALITIGGRPAMGKTTFILSIAEKLLEEKKQVLLYSLEMSSVQITKKMLCLISQVNSVKLKSGEISEKDYEKLADGIGKLSEWDLSINDTSSITTIQIEENIKELKPDVVFIDYLQLMSATPKNNRLLQIENILLELKRISRENNVIIFINSQLSRALENRYDKRPMLSDLRESGAIENISDVVIFLYRDEYYHYNEDDYEPQRKGETNVIVAKNKFGACGTVNIMFRADIPKFYDTIKEYRF